MQREQTESEGCKDASSTFFLLHAGLVECQLTPRAHPHRGLDGWSTHRRQGAGCVQVVWFMRERVLFWSGCSLGNQGVAP